MKKRLTQKLQQLIDNLPTGNKRKEAKEDLLSLKLSNSDYHYIMLADKYKDNLQKVDKEVKNKVVYLHRKKSEGTIFYVGMGEQNRAYTTHSRNKWWVNVYKKHDRVVDIVAKDLSIDDAYELEVFLISEIGRKDLGLGNLVNLDDGGKGATGHIPTQNARNKLSKRLSKKVINTETLEVLKSGTELTKKYGIFGNILQKDHPNSDWMKLEDYKNGKHLTEKWINRYKIKNSYVKIINTNTLDIFYSIEEATKSIGKGSYKTNQGQYNRLSQKLKGSIKNNSNFMYYDDYEKGLHLTKEWIRRKERKISKREIPLKEIEIYDFKKQVWFKTTRSDFYDKYSIKPSTYTALLHGRFCRKEYKKFNKTNNQWKNILNIETNKVERFNQWYLSEKLGVTSNNLSNLFLGRTKILYKKYKIID